VTLSLVGCCARTGMLGAIVMSSSPAVAARCARARARVGAACSQNVTDPALGDALLDRIAAGASAPDALAAVTAAGANIDHRQLTVVDAFGRSASFSGEQTLGAHADCTGTDCAAAGNLLADPSAPAAMAAAFAADPAAHLGDRLLQALRAGRDAGGEEGDVHSAGVIVVDGVMLGIGLPGQVKSPITWTLEGGRCTRIEGGDEADRLRSVIDGVPGADTIGEFAFGTSMRAPYGSPSEKGRLGTVHFALGDNHNAYPGGQNVSTLHLDGVILNASLQIVDDGTWIVKDGEWAL